MKTTTLSIKDNVFEVLLALSEEEQRQGLMHQEFPPPVMAFPYSSPRINKFWMHNTPSPLDIIFCKNGKVTQICFGEPFSMKTIGDNTESDLVVEFPHGTIDNLNLKIGDAIYLNKF